MNNVEYDHGNLFNPFPQENSSDMFGFSPRTSPVPFQSKQQSPISWQNGLQQYPNPLIHRQVPSPVTSAQTSPVDWTYRFSQQPVMAPPKIITQGHPGEAYLQFGQVTPPDESSPQIFQQYDNDLPQRHQEVLHVTETSQSGKRKRGSQNLDDNVKSSKRSRKSTARSKKLLERTGQISQNPEDEKRNKFLERNRVAASKCRQKKKEWTSNLETRARELQGTKHELNMMVSSYRDEIMFLKGEMLKHTTCGCDRIRNYLNQEADNIAFSAHSFHNAVSPIGSEPSSRLRSASSGFSNHGSSRRGSTEDQTAQSIPSSPGIQFKSEIGVESLPAISLVHDASDQTTARQTS